MEALTDDASFRTLVRQLLRDWSDRLGCNGDVEQKIFFKKKFLQRLESSQVAEDTDKANEQHYEVPTEFFQTILGRRLKYSSCYWPSHVSTLEQAEDEMMRLVCARAQLKNGDFVLDLGCGWGSMAFWIVEHYPRCRVVAVSNSHTQRAHIQSEAARRGYANRLEAITADANNFQTAYRFDRIISVEMFEHMKNYEVLFQRVSSWLKPAGRLFIQILCHRDVSYAFDRKADDSSTEWMARHFFSGGTMPSSDLFLFFQRAVLLEDIWLVNGTHYSKTLEAWLCRLDSNADDVHAVMRQAYGQDATEQVANWRKFFIYCSEAFGFGGGNEWIVAQYLFKKQLASML